MKKIQRKLAGVFVMAIVTANLTGCIPSEKEKINQAEELLEEKYGERFDVLEYYGKLNFEGDYEILAASEEHPDVLFEAKVVSEGSYISDEYVTARVCRTIEEQIYQNLSGLSGYLFVKVQAISKSIDSSNADMTVQEYISFKSKNRFVVYLHYTPEDKDVENTYQVIKNIFSGIEGMNGTIQLYVVEEDLLQQVQEYLDEHAKVDETYKDKLEGIDRISIPYENSEIQMTEEEFAEAVGGRV